MPEPSKLPEWATGGTADTTEPSASKKSEGYQAREKPIASTFNYLYNLIYQWIQYLQTWTQDHDHLDDGSDGSTSRISLENEIEYLEVVEAYAGSANGFWEVAIDGASEHRIKHQSNGATLTTYEDEALIANDLIIVGDDNDGTSVTDETDMIGTSRVFFVDTQNAGHTAGLKTGSLRPTLLEPSGDQLTEFPRPSSLHLGNLAKAVLDVELSWNGTTFDETYQRDYNIDTSTSGVITGAFQINLQEALADSDFMVQATVGTSSTRIYICHAQQPSDTSTVNLLCYRWDDTNSTWDDIFAGGGAGESGEILNLRVTCY